MSVPMRGAEVAKLLLEDGAHDAYVLIKENGQWRPISAVTPTGEHRNAVTFQTDTATEPAGASDEAAT